MVTSLLACTYIHPLIHPSLDMLLVEAPFNYLFIRYIDYLAVMFGFSWLMQRQKLFQLSHVASFSGVWIFHFAGIESILGSYIRLYYDG
ncbi:hypothetical protein ASPTUDRAFT_297614 [Aspergillus tubingensis CBS 134.48]|uniref:Uncharacterized protein n=1 Tax=Aspergillus tubingensis (strain CBS 134.48) TaxID=767770 RepID=A0A1L9NPP4_ASPTC|nr:hypothetical protein ASPTUDRAFT_297614 [Aspergillus tubingensis CBS 134.48]